MKRTYTKYPFSSMSINEECYLVEPGCKVLGLACVESTNFKYTRAYVHRYGKDHGKAFRTKSCGNAVRITRYL